jgi:hypothetical protein
VKQSASSITEQIVMPRKVGTPWKIDLSGKRFGRWNVLNRQAGSFWVCKCECGTEKIVAGNMLTLGKSVSCGCYAREINTTHGMEGTKTYNVWAGMKQRCQNEKYHGYARYGGRGVKVCKKWQTFEGFFEDMGEKPEGTSIERVDNDGNYKLGNCIWAPPKVQIRNRSNTKKITGESVASIAERTGIPIKRLRERIRAGLTGKDLLSNGKLNRWR